MTTTSAEALKAAVTRSLASRGALRRARAAMRAQVFAALLDKTDPPPTPSPETRIINELIREYLAFHLYEHTLAVFEPETGMPDVEPEARRVRPDVLAAQVGLAEAVSHATRPRLPLLYTLVAAQQQRERANRFLPVDARDSEEEEEEAKPSRASSARGDADPSYTDDAFEKDEDGNDDEKKDQEDKEEEDDNDEQRRLAHQLEDILRRTVVAPGAEQLPVL